MFQLHVQLSQQFVIYKQTNQHKLPNATEQRVTLQATNFRTTRGLYFMYVFQNVGARNEILLGVLLPGNSIVCLMSWR